MKTKELTRRSTNALLAALLLIAGCAPRPCSTKLAIHYVLDGSGSASMSSDQEVAAMVVDMESQPADADVTVSVMASKTVEIFSGSLSETEPSEVARVAKAALANPDPLKGTDFSAMAVALDSLLARTDAQKVKLRVMSDGGDDFAKDIERAKAYAAASTKIVKDKRIVSLVFHGVKTGFREPIRAHFGALGTKLKILSAGESSFD